MTASTTDRAPGSLAGRPALARCIAVPVEDFAASVWGEAPLLSRAADLPRDFADLFSADAVDELVASRGLRTPFLRVAQEGSTLPDRRFTASGGTGATVADQLSDHALADLFAGGATVVLQALHRTWSPLLEFCQDLAADLGHPVQCNAYVTPPQSQGFSDHYDVHDVFVLQTEGEKRWRVRAPVLPRPLRDQPWTDHRQAVTEAAREQPLLDVVLRPGDCLYLPRGYLHSATALGGVSTHLTVGVHTWTRRTLAEEVVALALAELARDGDARAALPLGLDATDPDHLGDDLAAVRDRLLRAVASVDAAAVADRLSRQARAAQRAAPLGPLAQARAVTGLDARTEVALRRHVMAALHEPGGAGGDAVVRSRGLEVPLAADDVASARRLLDGRPVRVADLPGEPGRDLALVRRMLRAGVVVPA